MGQACANASLTSVRHRRLGPTPSRRAGSVQGRAIDDLKESVPVWKKEVYEGGEEWIGRGS